MLAIVRGFDDGALLPGCAQKTTLSPVPAPTAGLSQVAEGSELFCLAESEEEAKEIAALYGIELVEFGYGVATFHTEENLNDVIQRGTENGWPLLEINHIMSLDDPVMPGTVGKTP